MINLNESFPDFNLKAVKPIKPNETIDLSQVFIDVNNKTNNQWRVIFFYPKDFTFVCPTELIGFGYLNDQFTALKTKVFAVSIDSEYTHLAWKEQNPKIGALPFPMISDYKRELATTLGIIDPVSGSAQRATFIIDPKGIIRFISVNDDKVGRNPDEILRILKALQTDQLCPCNWQEGQATIQSK